MNIFQLPNSLENHIEKYLNLHNLGFANSRKIASAIQELSDYYITHPQDATPWHKPFAQIAYCAYYLPLNFIRNLSVYREAQSLNFASQASHLIDFGSGTGAGSLPFLLSDLHRLQSLHSIEISPTATEIHQTLIKYLSLSKSWHSSWSKDIPLENSLGIFSYSLTEMTELPKEIFSLPHLILVEPSTKEDGRRLMAWRKNLQNQGFHIWAPCVHQDTCPLLEQSQRDWCHQRIHWQQPKWFQNIEKHLSIKNKTLTFSYLLASRETPPVLPKNIARLTGDSLKEKGKRRQLVCRGSKREFLTWMKKNKNDQALSRGILVELPDDLESKSNELRVTQNPVRRPT